VLSPVGSPSDVAIIIKNIPLTKINNIQAIQIFNSTDRNYGDRAIGLTVELYNSKNDPNFNTILAYSSEFIDNWAMYRIDFPSIDTYSLVFTGSKIVPNTGLYVNLVYLEDATINSFPFNILGNVDIVGDLTASSAVVSGAITASSAVVSGAITASSAIINDVNINTTLADILSRLTALENP
jgi:hypothetical protein